MYDRAHLTWIFLPILPFALGFTVLELLSDGTTDLLTRMLETDSFFPGNLDLRFYNGFIIYSAVGLFHISSCFAVICLMVSKIWELSPKARSQSLLVLGVSVLMLVLVNALARHEDFLGALNLTYRSTCAVLVKAGVAPHVLPEGCSDPGLSILAWFAVLPYLFGLLAAASASAVVSTGQSIKNLEAHLGLVDLTFQTTAFVLVTSTITLMLFYHLPLTVVADGTARELIRGFAQGMALFWGIVFTLTLLFIFGPSNLMLRKALEHEPVIQEDLRGRIERRSTRYQVTRILTILAPLLVGSSASILDMITQAL